MLVIASIVTLDLPVRNPSAFFDRILVVYDCFMLKDLGSESQAYVAVVYVEQSFSVGFNVCEFY